MQAKEALRGEKAEKGSNSKWMRQWETICFLLRIHYDDPIGEDLSRYLRGIDKWKKSPWKDIRDFYDGGV